MCVYARISILYSVCVHVCMCVKILSKVVCDHASSQT